MRGTQLQVPQQRDDGLHEEVGQFGRRPRVDRRLVEGGRQEDLFAELLRQRAVPLELVHREPQTAAEDGFHFSHSQQRHHADATGCTRGDEDVRVLAGVVDLLRRELRQVAADFERGLAGLPRRPVESLTRRRRVELVPSAHRLLPSR